LKGKQLGRRVAPCEERGEGLELNKTNSKVEVKVKNKVEIKIKSKVEVKIKSKAKIKSKS
jgi:hypothetical protein